MYVIESGVETGLEIVRTEWENVPDNMTHSSGRGKCREIQLCNNTTEKYSREEMVLFHLILLS